MVTKQGYGSNLMIARHPEKIHKKSNPIPRKPFWIRVKAPTSNFI